MRIQKSLYAKENISKLDYIKISIFYQNNVIKSKNASRVLEKDNYVTKIQ